MLILKTDEAVEQVVLTLMKYIEINNMRIVSHINGQQNAARMGKTVPADQILEVFRPDFAIKVWNACKPAGIHIPLRIHVYAEGGSSVVQYQQAQDIFSVYNNAALTEIAKELDALFEKILVQAFPQKSTEIL